METSTSVTVDVAELDVLNRDLPSYQPEPSGDSMVAEEMKATLPSMEPITLQAEFVGEMMVVSLMSPVLVTIGLRVITSPTSPTLVVASSSWSSHQPYLCHGQSTGINEDSSLTAYDSLSFSDKCFCHFLHHFDSETGGSFVFLGLLAHQE